MNYSSQTSPVVDELAGKIKQFFSIYGMQHYEGNIYFFVVPKEAKIPVEGNGSTGSHIEPEVVYQKLWTAFAEKGYQLSFKYELGEQMLIGTPLKPAVERRWINVALILATFFTTMVMGSFLFGADPIINPYDALKGIPFTIAIMSVLGAHEAGHYIVAKKHGMHTSLPYFIPVPFPPIGTMGAVIKHRGPIPNRKALFDVGIAGPLLGLAVSIVVTIIGLLQPPLQKPPDGLEIQLSLPPLFEFLTRIIPAGEASLMHPVAFAGWVGMLVTALNLIPAGQLDGGHVLRAMIGGKASRISNILPFVLFFTGAYISIIQNLDGSIWIFWGALLFIFAASGHPRPLDDDIPLGTGRMVLGVITFALGLLCVTLVPFQIS